MAARVPKGTFSTTVAFLQHSTQLTQTHTRTHTHTHTHTHTGIFPGFNTTYADLLGPSGRPVFQKEHFPQQWRKLWWNPRWTTRRPSWSARFCCCQNTTVVVVVVENVRFGTPGPSGRPVPQLSLLLWKTFVLEHQGLQRGPSSKRNVFHHSGVSCGGKLPFR